MTFLWAAADRPTPGDNETNPFSDVGMAYYPDPVRWAYHHDPGITAGIGNVLFDIGLTCTREQVVTFLYAFLVKR